MNRITVVGSLNMDLSIATTNLPVTGETVFGKDFRMIPGGKGANQAISASLLGGNVKMIGCVGDDLFGKALTDNLSASGIDAECIKISQECNTGVAMIILNQGDNSIVINSGANSELSEMDIKNNENIICESNVLLTQLETPFNTVKKALEIAKKYQIKTILNPAPARHIDYDVFKLIDVLIPNRTECETITGMKVSTVHDAVDAVRELMNKGLSQVILTLGSNGVVYNDNEKIVHVPARKVDVVDTTGAGDSFAGAIAYCLAEGMEINSAIEFAIVVSSLTVTKRGASSSIPKIPEVKKIIEKEGLNIELS